MNGIGWAIKQMQNGSKVSRAGWNGKFMWLALQTPDEHSKMTLPYIYMSTAQGDLVPWLASQTDILATDWDVVGNIQRLTPGDVRCNYCGAPPGEPCVNKVHDNIPLFVNKVHDNMPLFDFHLTREIQVRH